MPRCGRPAPPGHLAKRDTEYERCGTANLFAVVEPKAGRHLTRATPDRSACQFAHPIRDLVAAYPTARTIHVVMDNLNTHTEKSLTDHLGPREGRALWRRLTVHYTPKHGSWLNQAEIELSLIARQCLGRRRLSQLSQLRAAFPPQDHTRQRQARARILRELRAERVSSSRGRAVPRGVKRKMSNYPLRPRRRHRTRIRSYRVHVLQRHRGPHAWSRRRPT